MIGREPISPLWSLAEEEQFYLLWPALLILALAYKLRGHYLEWLIGAAILVICTERYWLQYGAHAARDRIYASPETAADALLAGVLLALLRRRGYRVDPVFAGVAAVFLAIATYLGTATPTAGPIIDIAGFALVGLAVERSGLARILSWRPLVRVGLISYSLYLWHMVVLSWFGYREPWFSNGYHHRIIALALAIAIASLSYRFVETRFRRSRHVESPARRPRLVDPSFGGGGAVTVAAAREISTT